MSVPYYALNVPLKVGSATFLLVCFVSLKESTCGARKNVFNFTLKVVFVIEIIKFSFFRYSKCDDVIKIMNEEHSQISET